MPHRADGSGLRGGVGIELVALPGSSPDLNPTERLWEGMREEVTRGHCHASLTALAGGLPGVRGENRCLRDRRRGPALADARPRPGARGETPGRNVILV